jgi:hypothetical protein
MTKLRTAKPKKKLGRPAIFSPELAEHICAELACGRSLRSICRADDMPALRTIFYWLRTNPDFLHQYEMAKVESADALIEEILDIADDASGDYIEDDEGNRKFNSENVQRSRLRVDARKWIASKLKPKRWGERVDMNHGLQPENPLASLIASIQGSAFKPVASLSTADENENA